MSQADTANDDSRLALALLHRSDVPPQLFDELAALSAEGAFDLDLQPYEPTPFAGVEWYLPTFVVLYLAKGYFDGFLNEMGADHYKALKDALMKLRARLDLVKVTVFATEGKATADDTYSRAYSMVIPAGDHSFKFLLRNDLSEQEQERELDLITAFVDSCHTDTVSDRLVEQLQNTRVMSRTVLLACDFEANEVVVVDALAAMTQPRSPQDDAPRGDDD